MIENGMDDGTKVTAQPTFVGLFINMPKPNSEIWIADDVYINCRMRYHWWNAMFLRLVFGWKVKKIK